MEKLPNDLIQVLLTRAELEFLVERCDRKAANLAASGLKDTVCYIESMRISSIIRMAIATSDELNCRE